MEEQLKLYLDNSSTFITGSLKGDNYKGFKEALGYYPEDAMWSQQNNPHWDGLKSTVCYNKQYCHCAVKKDGMHFPTGLISKAISYFREKEIPYEISDVRHVWDARTTGFSMSPIGLYDKQPFQLYPYQQDAVDKAIAAQRGIIKIATGGGKTKTAAGIIAALGVSPTIFYVTSKELLLQAKADLEEVLLKNGLPIEVGMIGCGHKEIREITVMTVQTAVRAIGEKYVKFDDEDENDSTDIEDIKKDIADLIRSAKLIICDECITGDAFVITEDGPMRMENLSEKIGKEVQSFDGDSVVWKKITHFYRKGKRKIVKIVLSDGKNLRCTMDHPIKTSKGWLPAAAIGPGDQILCSVNADVVNGYPLSESHQVDTQNTFLDTKLVAEAKMSCFGFSLKQPMLGQTVNVAAAKESNYITVQSSHSLQTKEVENITPTSMVMTNDLTNGTNISQQKTNKQFSERFSETHHYHSHQSEAKIQDSIAITDCANPNGQNTNQIDFHFLPQNIGSMTTGDMEIDQLRSELLATLNYRSSTELPIKMERSKSQNSGLIPSETSDLHGGYAMTDMEERITSNYTQNLSLSRKLKSLQNGFLGNTENAPSINQEDTELFTSAKMPERQSSELSTSMFQNVCDINYVTVESIESCGEEEVYDISVEDTHCFFANGMLVHNCQHWAAETCQVIADNSMSCRWRYGLSATPYRDKGDDILIEACFGRQIIDINASWLIKNGFLVKPYISFIPVTNYKGQQLGPYPSVYKTALVENGYRNEMIGKLADNLVSMGRTVLVLVQQIHHGELLTDLIKDSVFMHGQSGNKLRKEHIKKIKSGHAPVTISSTIFDEGIDCKPLDALILAGGGKSPTRALQRIGRVIRKYTYPDGRVKDNAFVYDFRDHQKYLSQHALVRQRIYNSEPEFVVKEHNGK